MYEKSNIFNFRILTIIDGRNIQLDKRKTIEKDEF